MEYNERIAASTPLPPTWKIGVEMSDDLMNQIMSYGAECAKKGYEMAYGLKAS